MKYVMTGSEFHPQIVLGHDVSHEYLSKCLIGRADSAGHVEVKDGKVRTYGKSIGLNLYPAERDASFIAAYLGIGYENVHPENEFKK